MTFPALDWSQVKTFPERAIVADLFDESGHASAAELLRAGQPLAVLPECCVSLQGWKVTYSQRNRAYFITRPGRKCCRFYPRQHRHLERTCRKLYDALGEPCLAVLDEWEVFTLAFCGVEF